MSASPYSSNDYSSEVLVPSSELRVVSVLQLRTKNSKLGTFLSVTFTHHDVIRPKNRHDIGNHIPSRHMVKGPHVDEGRGPDLEPIGFASPRTHDIKAQLPFMGLGPTIDVPFWCRKARGK